MIFGEFGRNLLSIQFKRRFCGMGCKIYNPMLRVDKKWCLRVVTVNQTPNRLGGSGGWSGQKKRVLGVRIASDFDGWLSTNED